MEELKPCPFCGGEARMHVAFASGGDHSVGVYVECLECRSCSGTKWGDGAQEKAADAWNRRANDCDREYLLALADELESCGPGCDECPVLGQAECLRDRECTENVSRYCERRIREISGHDACEVTTVSAYDLLGDDDREALAWVREMGGVEAAKARTIPEGCEWPRFEETPMDNYEGEEWRPVNGFDGKYEVSNYGRVRSIDHEVKSLVGYRTVKGRILKQRVEHGYCRVQLSISKYEHTHKQVHRLVAEEFVPNPDNKPEVNHIDGCKTNNFAENLEWVTSSENSVHAIENGLQRPKTDEELQKMWDASSKPVIRDDGEWYASASKAAEAIGAERSSVAKSIRRGGSIYGHTYRYANDGECVKRPAPKVLDADGVPIKEGDEVWSTRDSKSGTVVYAYPPGDYGQPSMKVGATWHHASDLTHAKTERDSWERVEEDATLGVNSYRERYGIKKHDGMTWPQLVREDLVRRCRALAERERGE